MSEQLTTAQPVAAMKDGSDEAGLAKIFMDGASKFLGQSKDLSKSVSTTTIINDTKDPKYTASKIEELIRVIKTGDNESDSDKLSGLLRYLDTIGQVLKSPDFEVSNIQEAVGEVASVNGELKDVIKEFSKEDKKEINKVKAPINRGINSAIPKHVESMFDVLASDISNSLNIQGKDVSFSDLPTEVFNANENDVGNVQEIEGFPSGIGGKAGSVLEDANKKILEFNAALEKVRKIKVEVDDTVEEDINSIEAKIGNVPDISIKADANVSELYRSLAALNSIIQSVDDDTSESVKELIYDIEDKLDMLMMLC